MFVVHTVHKKTVYVAYVNHEQRCVLLHIEQKIGKRLETSALAVCDRSFSSKVIHYLHTDTQAPDRLLCPESG